MASHRVYAVAISLLLVIVNGVSAQGTMTYSGSLSSATPERTVVVELEAGQTVLAVATRLSGDLDTFLTLRGPDGTALAENDDRTLDTFDSALGYTAGESGSYTLVLSRFEGSDSRGQYELQVSIGGDELLDELNTLTRVTFSSTEETIDTPSFRIHFTRKGEDTTTLEYAQAVALAAEKAWDTQVNILGWPAPPPDGVLGGDGRYDIYIIDLSERGTGGGGGGVLFGAARPDGFLQDNPNSTGIEQFGTSSYLVVENDFAESVDENRPAVSLMFTTIAHEFNHALQFGYDIQDAHSWYYEATATWMETIIAGDEEEASGYVELNYTYPEICFGAESGPTAGDNRYGYWLYIQSLVDAHDESIIAELWVNIADYDGFAALEKTLNTRGSTIAESLARYRVQNLLRDYELAPEFQAAVWLENTIDGPGRWTFTGNGIQELSANYFLFNPKPGTYSIDLVEDDGALQLWAIGIRGDEGVEIPLGRGGVVATDGFDYVYLMAFNPVFDEDVEQCSYRNYALNVRPANGTAAAPTRMWDAAHFTPPG